jgi:AcrR family transcriptional regulator
MPAADMRLYGGVTGADRKAARRAELVEAGLDLLGGAEGDQLTVRRACQHAGLATRYFYESFADRDELVSAVYEHVVQSVATATLAAVEAADSQPPAKILAGLAQLVRVAAGDPRHGRVLFSVTLVDPLLARRRLESSRFFAHLLIGQARQAYGVTDSPALELVAQFIVGGLAQTLTAWLSGTLEVSEAELVAECAEIFTAIANRHKP